MTEHKKNCLRVKMTNLNEAVTVTNNRAQYFADLAKKYRDETREIRDDAKQYAEKNADVTAEDLETARATLERKIEKEVDEVLTTCVLKEDLPTAVSAFENDANYVNHVQLENAVYNSTYNVLRETQITNCILEKPKYLDWTYEGGVITLKAGSKLMYPDGFNSDGSRKFSYYTTTKDYIFNYSSPSATSLRWLSISRKQFTLNFGQGMLYVGDTAPTTFASKYMLWYDTTNNILKYTDDSGATWSTDDGTFPFMTAKTIAGQDGIEYPQNVFDGIGIMDRCIWVADGIKALAPNGRNEDGTLNNKETTSKASVVISTWVNVSPEGAPIGIGGNSGTVTFGALYYVESETEPTSTYTIWYNPVRNEIFYKKKDGTLERAFWATVGFYDATYGGIYANHLSLTNSNFKEAFRAVDYNDFANLKDEVESIPTPIPSYASGVSITFAGLKNYTAPNDGIIMFKMYPYGNRSTLGLTVNGYSIPVDVNGPQDDADTQSASFLVAKGDVVKHTNTTTPRAFTCMFYPFRKGV